MPRRNDKIRMINVQIRLGQNPTFEVRADEDVDKNPCKASFSQTGFGPANAQILQSVLSTMKTAWRDLPETTTLCVDNNDRILEKRSCRR